MQEGNLFLKGNARVEEKDRMELKCIKNMVLYKVMFFQQLPSF
jgi:hypothetical protein